MADTLSELGFIPRLTLFPLLRVLGEQRRVKQVLLTPITEQLGLIRLQGFLYPVTPHVGVSMLVGLYSIPQGNVSWHRHRPQRTNPATRCLSGLRPQARLCRSHSCESSGQLAGLAWR